VCGRGKLTATPEELRRLFEVDPAPLEPHWNISPTQPIAIIRTPGALEEVRFGLVPSWSREPKMKWINARAETVTKQGAFKTLLRERRCLVIVDGFYEWKRIDKKHKVPHLVTLPSGEPFAMAGLWDRWSSRDGEIIDSCAVLTVDAVPPVRELHDRMPLILEPEAYHAWLDVRTAHPETLLERVRRERLVAVAVSDVVNNPRNDDPRCAAPLGSEA